MSDERSKGHLLLVCPGKMAHRVQSAGRPVQAWMRGKISLLKLISIKNEVLVYNKLVTCSTNSSATPSISTPRFRNRGNMWLDIKDIIRINIAVHWWAWHLTSDEMLQCQLHWWIWCPPFPLDWGEATRIQSEDDISTKNKAQWHHN